MPVGDKLYQQILDNFKKGLYYEANNDYSKVNDSIPDKDSQALGKYQFVPKYHWSKIKSLAAQRKMPVPKTYDDFLNEPLLQEEYFENYFQKEVYPFVNQNKNNTRELSADELAYLYHHNGKGGAQTYVTTGKLPEATKYNPSGEEFIKGYKASRENQGGTPVMAFTQTFVDGKYKSFNAELAAINKNPNKLSEDLLNEKRIQTQLKYQKEGLITYFNYKIQQENKVSENANKDKYEALKTMSDSLQDEDALNMVEATHFPEILPGMGKQKTFNIKISKEKIEALKNNEYFNKNYGKFLKKAEDVNDPLFGKVEKDFYYAKIPFNNDKNNLINQFEKDVRSVKGNENFAVYKDGKITKNGLFNIFKSGDSASGGTDTITNNLGTDTHLNIAKHSLNSIKDAKVVLKPLLEPIAIPEPPVEEKKPAEEKKPEPVNPVQPTTTEMDKWIAYDKQKQKTADDNVLNDYFSSERDIPVVEDPNAKKKDMFPYADILSQAAGTALGLSMANKKINYRDEQVNDDFRNYAAELSKLSKMGLRPEEEGYAKRMLTEAYQGSVDRVVAASNGNRNSVLGNLGRVDQQRNEGLMNIALADAQAKNESLHKYGEAMKYINEFDARRDIANNERKYENILKTKQAGAELAGSSMAAFIDTIHNYQDNRPGSWNDVYKSHMSRRFFDVDITLKDDGTGNTPYTASWKAKKENELITHTKEYNQYKSLFTQLKPEDQKIINDHFRQSNGDIESTYKLIDQARNPQNSGNSQNSDYSNMFKADPSITTTPVSNATNANPSMVNQKVPDLLSGNMPAYQQPVASNVPAQEDEGQKTLNLLKSAKSMMQDVLVKSDEGLIEADKKNELIDDMYKTAQKMF